MASTDPSERLRLKEDINRAVMLKAKEVGKYIDPSITVTFGVAVVPDAVYDLCMANLTELFELHVVLISYSMFVPYLLLVYQTVLKANRSIDVQMLEPITPGSCTFMKSSRCKLLSRLCGGCARWS